MGCNHSQGQGVLCDESMGTSGRGQAWGQELGSCLLQSLVRGRSWEIY